MGWLGRSVGNRIIATVVVASAVAVALEVWVLS
jgi:hypothetical protein